MAAHQHWHIDVSYLNIGGTFYYLCSILDGYSQFIVNWDIRESMIEADILQGAKEKFPEARPRIISDNGPQFIAKDFKEFIRISGMTHVRTSPVYRRKCWQGGSRRSARHGSASWKPPGKNGKLAGRNGGKRLQLNRSDLQSTGKLQCEA